MSDHSDSDSSPKGSDSSSGVGDDEKKHSSDESASSDGVLVELPANADQDDSREDMFEDATDEPATPGDAMETPRGLEESMAMIEIGESSARRDAEELARMRARLEDSVSECKKYREEREVFGREVASLRRLLLDMAKCDSLATSSEEADIPSPTPLHAMLADCSKFALHLKTNDDRSDLKDLLLTKEQELEDLRAKNMESVVSHDVISSYLDSLHGSWSESLKERLLTSLDTVIGEEGPTDSADVNVLSLVEKKTLSLVEIHRQFLSEIDQIRQCLAGFRPEFENFADFDSITVLTTARERLIEAKKREDDDLDGLNKIKNENEGLQNQIEKLKSSLDVASAETSKVKGELEQAESKYIAVKEKLSMAVTKGKSLVQTRDSLKQSLAEKNGELEKCMGELKVISDALHSSEVRVEEFQRLLEEKTNEFESCLQQLQASETTVERLQGLIAEKSGGLETCMQELKEKNDELRASNLIVEDLRRLLEEKTTAFESSMQELQATEITIQELRRSLEEKNTELQICVQELKEKSEELQESEVKVAELQKLLEEKTTGFETHLEQHSAALQDVQELLEVKSSDLEQCMLELQQKSDLLQASEAAVKELEKAVEEKVGELEKLSVESQQKIGHVQATEVTIKELEVLLEEKKSELERREHELQASEHMVQDLQKVLEEKKSELDRCALDLQQKSDVLQATELKVKQLEQSLEEQAGKLDKCTLDLHTSEATVRELEKLLEEKELRFQETEMTISELKKLVEEQSGELEKRSKESTERSLELETVKAGMGELSNAQSTLNAIQLSLSQKENKLQEMEIILGEFSYPDELSLADPIEKLRWIGDQKRSFESKVKDALASVTFPETDSSIEIDSQIIWLLESLNQAREDASKSKEESSLVNLQLSALNEEINRLTESLSEEKQERNVLTNEVDDLLAKLTVISSEKHELIKALEESFHIKYDGENPSTELVIEKCISSIRETAKSTLLNSANLEKLQSLLFERDQELDMCKKLLEEDAVGKTEIKSLSEEVERLKNERGSLQKELERVEEKDAVGKTEIKSLTEEVERLKNEKDSLEKELERVEEKDAVGKTEIKSLTEEVERLKNEKDSLQKELERVEEKDAVGKTEIKSLYEEVERLKNEKDSLQKELERVEEKNALVREKLSMAVKKGKGLVAEREGFKQALDEKSAEIEALKADLKSKDSIVKNLREQVNELSPQLTSVNELELKAVSLQEKLDEAKNSLEESENVKARVLKELSEAMSTSQILENELGKEKERISNIIKEKEEILREKEATEQELERVNKEVSTSASKLTDAFVKIKSLEDALSKAKKDALLLDSAQMEVVTRHEKEISELSAKLADCTEELRETRGRLEKSLSERTSELEKIKEVMQDETLLSMVKEEFRRKINSLRGMGLLMHDMHQQFSAKGYSIDPSIEVSGFVKFLSLPSYDKFINERNAHNNSAKRNWSEVNSISSMAEGLVDQSKHISKYFEDLSSYMDDHITLMSQALQATSEEFFHMMDSEDNVKLELEKLEVQYKAQEEKLKKAELGSERASKDLQIYEERIATLEKDYFNLEGVCNELKSKIEDYQARDNLLKSREDELALLPQGLIKDRGLSGLYFSEDEMASLIDKVNTLEFSFTEPESTPLEKLFNILDHFDELHQRVDFLTYENGDLQSALASSSTETDNLKSEYETIHVSLEKIVQKLVQLGGKDIPPDQKQATTMALLSFLEKVVVSLVHDYENSKLKLMEMEGKLQTREKMVGELSSRVKMLEDSYQSWASQAEIGRERSLVDASSSSKNTDEIEDLGAVGKSSITSTAARMTTRKVSSDHLILNIGTETDRLIAAQESEGKGHVFKSLNTSGLIPVQGKFIADKVDSAWVSGSRVLMSQPRARLGVVAYCLFLHLWFLGSIVL